MNGECPAAGGCGPGSPQDRWLVNDLAAHPATCTLAYWHQPRFSSGAPAQGSDVAYQRFWEDLYAFHADVVLNGHAHDYERFAPQTPTGQASQVGIREFVVGTGGAGQLPLGTLQPNSEVQHTGTLGVLRLTLHASSYDWQFLPVTADGFTGRRDWYLPLIARHHLAPPRPQRTTGLPDVEMGIPNDRPRR